MSVIDLPVATSCRSQANMGDIMNQRTCSLSHGLFLVLLPLLVLGQDDGDDTLPEALPMTTERLGELVLRIDPEARQEGPSWRFIVDGFEAMLIYDGSADRMRVMIPINDVDDLPPGELVRLLQANFDSALDARYAIANDILWSVFIHPLSTLSDTEFLLGVGQTVNVAATFGRGYSSGMFMFGGGDSRELERKRLLEELEALSETPM